MNAWKIEKVERNYAMVTENLNSKFINEKFRAILHLFTRIKSRGYSKNLRITGHNNTLEPFRSLKKRGIF